MVTTIPRDWWILRYVDNIALVGLAVVVMARLRDAGWPAWIGAVGFVFFGFLLSFILAFVARPSLTQLQTDPFTAVPGLWIPSVGVIAMVVGAGLLRTREPPDTVDWSEFSDPTMAPERKRIEPRF